jgi:heat shock protein HslJ
MFRNHLPVIAVVMILADALAAPAAGTVPSAEQLANMTYTSIFEHPVTLKNGRWEGKPFVAGGTTRPAVGLVGDFILTGDLDGDGTDEAVVLLWESSGGSGTFDYIAVVGTRNGVPYNLGTALIGERVQVRAGRIIGNRIELDVVEAGPDDAACCPGQKATRSWSVDATGLHVNATKITGRQSLADLDGTQWVLNRFNGEPPLAAQPEITLAFDGGRISGSSGCNRYFAGVKETGELPGDLQVSRIGGTRMACPGQIMALENRYLEALGHVVRYSFVAGRLELTWRKDNRIGTLVFTPEHAKQRSRGAGFGRPPRLQTGPTDTSPPM